MDRQTSQRTQAQEKARPERAADPRIQETEPLVTASLAARLSLTGFPIRVLPPETLTELASTVGNSAMAELMALERPGVRETPFRLPEGMPGTGAFQVPARTPQLIDAPVFASQMPAMQASGPGALV